VASDVMSDDNEESQHEGEDSDYGLIRDLHSRD